MKEAAWGAGIVAFFIAVGLILGYLNVSVVVDELSLSREVDLSPPGIDVSDVRTAGKILKFEYVVDDTKTGDSEIYDTAVILFRTPIGNESVEPEKIIVLLDQKSGIDYEIKIPLKDIDKNTDKDDNGLVKVGEKNMDWLDITEVSPSKLIVEGNFSGFKIYDDCKYYLLVIAVDYWGNARWKFYDVTEYVLKLADSSGGGRRSSGGSPPGVWSNNVVGRVEPRFSLINHYFVLNGVVYAGFHPSISSYRPLPGPYTMVWLYMWLK